MKRYPMESWPGAIIIAVTVIVLLSDLWPS